ncbi:DUF1190 domain-containing protein [Profundibacterium mesophilum]|uniref:Integral membrane protein n=1 Tax=Profundibacterium mesophilum KAUST100406-0324 TaxID=1037889 RepID=A0A921NWI8_9RHOB|nr:DUF1190 domain-containing protein [Profundibacterium mesophilum]KAF0676059.1 putative integral membrane protein [Profundibacterium mesophilum KAUST100406-0324]
MSVRTKKRSKTACTVLLGFSALTLAACEDDTVEAQLFESEAQCEAQGQEGGSWWTPEDCEEGFAQARAEHAEAAPRYDALEVCEEQHGEGMCQEDQFSQGGGFGSIFLPLMAGYMIGNALSGKRAKPLYAAKGGGFATAGGTTRFARASGSTRLSPASLTRASSTINARPMSRATVSRSGGFGAARTSSGSRSFGG